MSDEITSATLQMTGKAVEVGSLAVQKSIEIIAMLLKELAQAAQRHGQRQNEKQKVSKNQDVTSTDLTDIKPGAVSMKELVKNAKANKDTISFSEQAITKDDMKYLSKKAKEYQIPIAFTGSKGKDNVYANVRSSDLPAFQHICTEMMKDKLAERPQQMGNFKVQEWEMSFITHELNKHDLSASFGKTKAGNCICLYEKKDEKAILIARDEFVRKCKDVEKELQIGKDDEGFYRIENRLTGRKITFDKVPSKAELTDMMQERFGYDENKAALASAKFGEKTLTGADKAKYFSNDPQNAFSEIHANVELKGESIYAKDYSCWYLKTKADKMPKVVYQDKEGNFAVLQPEKMSKRKMAAILEKHLGIKDKAVASALIEKAEKVSDFYERSVTENLNHSLEFKESDIISGQTRTFVDEKHAVHQIIPQSAESTIERNGQDSFTVKSTVTGTDQIRTEDRKYEDQPVSDTKELKLSFSDKRAALQELSEMYKEQGLPDEAAEQMAKDVFEKAENQSAEKVLNIQEVRQDAMTVAFGTVTRDITTADKQAAASKIAAEFGVPSDTAEAIVEKAQEIKIDAVQKRVDAVQGGKTDFDTALNRRTDRDQIKQDSMVVCSAANPERHIVVAGDHNGERVTHDYSLFNGQQQIGNYSDAHTMDAAGQPITEANGRCAWTNLKEEMDTQLGMGNAVLTFESEQAYQEYMSDRELLMQLEKDGASIADKSPKLITEQTMGGNGHKANLPEMPEMPMPKTRGRH